MNFTFDDHHSPVRAEMYIQFRLQTMLSFYKRRIPSYSNAKGMYSIFLIFGNVFGAMLSFFGYSSYVPIITTVTTAVISWTEFSTTARKLARYSGTAVALESLLIWWDCMSDV